MNGKISASELREGDVLLYRGTAWISRLIQLLDGTAVSHASLFLGKNQAGEEVVGEALMGEGLVEKPLDQSVFGAEWVCVRRRPPEALVMGPVLQRARWYLDQGERYAYEQILLLAIICLTRKVPLKPSFGVFLRAVVDRAAAFLQRLTAGGQDREPMICSEFAYRCYDEATPPPNVPYHLEIEWAATFQPAAALAGAGIDPQSVLARLRAQAGPLAVFNDVKSALAARDRTAVADWAAGPPLEAVAKQYLAELGDATVPEEDLALEEVVGPVQNLALRICDSDLFGARTRWGAVGLDSTSPLFDRFFTTVADFVTPGDLLRTPSLEDKGVVCQGPG
jgi:hypothetical protein